MTNTPYSYCNVAGGTDIGCRRQANEDWLDSFYCDNGLVTVVCDGMGGHVGGQVASHVAIDAIRALLWRQTFNNAADAIVAACNAANQAILRRAEQQPELRGMGSTCVMLIVRDGKVYIGSIGDSRVYLIRSKTIRQLTRDQSFVQMLVDAGQITKEEAERHPRRNEITNALGLPTMQPATVLPTPIVPEAGDCFLLCSDGLSGMVSDDEICRVVSNQANMSQQQRVDELIRRARDHGGLDNITCQIVEFATAPDARGAGGIGGLNRTKAIAIAAGVVLLAAVVGMVAWKKLATEKPEEMPTAEATHTDSILITKSVQPKDTIVFKKGNTILELEEKQDSGLNIAVFAKGGKKKLSFDRDSLLDCIKIEPAGLITYTRTGDKATCNFNDKYEATSLNVTFTAPDTTISLVFAVESPTPDAPTKSMQQNGESTKANQEGGTVLVDNLANRHCTVELSKEQMKKKMAVIHIKVGNGTNINDTVFIPQGVEVLDSCATGWCSMAEIKDNKYYRLTIDNSKIPKDPNEAKVDIPLKRKDNAKFTIHVRKPQ